MKRYLTYKRKKINDNLYEDPNTNNRVSNETCPWTTFTETCYQVADGRFIAIIEYADTTTDEEVEAFRILDTAFDFTFLDETEANAFLSELWDVTVSNHVFTDNRDWS